MSRRHLTLAVVAFASLVVSACSGSPTSPVSGLRAGVTRNADTIIPPDSSVAADSTKRSGYSGSNT